MAATRTPKSKARLLAEEICEKFPDASNLGLARKLRTEYPVHFASVELARNMVRVIRGAYGNDARKHATQPREKGQAGQLPSMPPSLAEPFEPFHVEGCKRVGIVSDIHVPYHSEQAWDAAMKHLAGNAIDTLVINGDYCDFYRLSRYEKDPGKRHFSEELKSCVEGLRWMRSVFPKARIVLKAGNHEERFDHFIWQRAPELYDVPQCRISDLLQLPSLGIEYVYEQRPVFVGKLCILHGHEFKAGFAPAVNPARGAFLRSLHSVLVGHHHRTSTHVEPDMFGREIAVWSTGHLAAPNPEYNRFAKSNHGFAYCEVASDGEYNVENYRMSKDWKVRTA
jgi:predicted phosphodiesterase